MNWLITGKENMYLKEDSTECKQTNPPIKTNKNSNNSEQIKSTNCVSWTDTKNKTIAISVSKNSLAIPILKNRVSAGPGKEWDLPDFSEERLPILKRFVRRFTQEKIFSAEIRGDSMTGIKLFDGDLVVFVQNLIEGDGIYVISVDGELLVKRL
jgi:phage repressor protein C with HTH and peptisase S24 domain